MDSKRKAALIVAAIATVLFVIIFSLPSHSINSYEYTLSTLISMIGSSRTSYSLFVPGYILVFAIMGMMLILNKKSALIGYGFALSAQGVSFAAMINFYVTVASSESRGLRLEFCGFLEYVIFSLFILSACLYIAADVTDARKATRVVKSTQPRPAVPNKQLPTKEDLDKLNYWKNLVDQGLITQLDYEKKKNEILGL